MEGKRCILKAKTISVKKIKFYPVKSIFLKKRWNFTYNTFFFALTFGIFSSLCLNFTGLWSTQ